MLDVGLTRRRFLKYNLAGAGLAAASLVTSGVAFADPQSADADWIANHIDTRLLGADGQPVVGLPKWTRMRILHGFPNGLIQVWVPRFNLVGKVAANAIGPVPTPGQHTDEILTNVLGYDRAVIDALRAAKVIA